MPFPLLRTKTNIPLNVIKYEVIFMDCILVHIPLDPKRHMRILNEFDNDKPQNVDSHNAV